MWTNYARSASKSRRAAGISRSTSTPNRPIRDRAGYSARNDLATAITRVNLEGFNRLYGFYFSFNTLQRRYTALANDIAAQSDLGLALDNIGWMVCRDFRDSERLNRDASIRAYQGLLANSPLRQGIYQSERLSAGRGAGLL